ADPSRTRGPRYWRRLGLVAGVHRHPPARGAAGAHGRLRRRDRLPDGLHHRRRRAPDRASHEGQFVRAVPVAPGRVRAVRSGHSMDLTPAAKRAFQIQSYGPAPSIDGVEIVELKRLSDDGGSMTELARLADGHPQAFAGFVVRQINYSEVEP